MVFGGGLRWCHEDMLAGEMGLSRRAFRRLCSVLHVPMLELHKDRLVCIPMFHIAMWAISRIGEPDFLVPGCHTMERPPTLRRDNTTTTLDLARLQRNLELIIKEMVYVSRLDHRRVDADAISISKEAAKRMIQMGVQNAPLFALHTLEEQANASLNESPLQTTL